MKENGYSSILLEVRGHGKSDGNRICLGYEEVNDVKAAVDYINQQEKYKDIPIVVQGVSMGGAVAVNAFGQIKDIDALIAMSAYSSFEDVVLDEMKEIGIPGFIRSIEMPLIRSSLKMTYGSYKVNHIKPVEQIRNANRRPVLLIANQKDTEVPVINMHRLKNADPEAVVWLRNSWEHFIIKNCDFKNVTEDKEYCSKILEFIENNVSHK
jgi:esterase/lipase